ncbi:1,4-dihydroxy-6-naphthoate synthase [Lewinellaceae bacterium SD302]|nr:1,4-dihydroxy-6-naphthoate synthase [Lewinellaceae bacterium SD302]
MTLTLGYSPCPNDTFIFDALVHKRIDTEGLDFKVALLDVATLNAKAFDNELDITKLSYHAFGYLTKQYALLRSGSALGRNCGPLLLSKKILDEDKIIKSSCAIPGRYTTANFLLGLAYPGLQDKREMFFHEIEDAILGDTATTGLVIHENRFTYAERGLVKLRDLGEFWEESTGYPIPLGGIVVNRRLPQDVQQKVERVIAKSVRYAFDNPEVSADYVQAHAQSMDPKVREAHIKLYVNHFSEDLGDEGIAAVDFLLNRGKELGIVPFEHKDFLVHSTLR